MSKSTARRRKRAAIKQQRTGRRKLIIIVCLPLCILLASITVARWPTLPGIAKPSAPAPPGNFNANSPSKEYIYVGGRLIATEEPSAPAPAAPSSISALAATTSSVAITWTSTDQTVDHFEVQRAEHYQGPFMPVSPNPGANDRSITDSGLTPGKAYLYQVRAVNAAGVASPYKADIATAIVFTDELANTTPIKAKHLVELRQAVNAVRRLAGLPDATWTYPEPVSEPSQQRRGIYLEDVTDLRTNLQPALQALGIDEEYPANPPLVRVGIVNKEHFQQIRDRVK
ncbi:MAG TPA: fibronectin type III domain-containing protein [Pyrinomonadaceae bacterium]|jgi:hypothetical protein